MGERNIENLIKPELVDIIFTRAGRDLFDPYCHEYNSLTPKERFDNLVKIHSSGLSISTVIRNYDNFWKSKDRIDISDSIVDGLCNILEYLIEQNEIKT